VELRELFICLFICDLLGDATSTSEYRASNGRIVNIQLIGKNGAHISSGDLIGGTSIAVAWRG
jgi:hypothetical protein